MEEESNSKSDNMSQLEDVKAFVDNGLRSIVNGVRCSNKLASLFSNMPEENSTFNNIMDYESKKLLKLMTTILNNQRIHENISQRDTEEKFELLIQSNDTLLDRVSVTIDEIAGIRWNPCPDEAQNKYTSQNINGSWNKNQLISVETKSKESPVRLLTAKNIQRPQIKFKDKIDNTNSPFYPILKDKPNNIKPLSLQLEMTDDGIEYFPHPYEMELDQFSASDDQLKKADPPREYRPLEATPLEMISHPEQIKPLVEELLKYNEIAIDLEHHSYRTYQGITCLMQISTVDKDYIIDTLLLRNSLELLNEVFTKPNIIKVFHGADLDIIWLQRDLGLYVVGLFDTHQAAKTLGFHRLSLAFLLKRYCKFDPNKHFQLADWRIRPLPEELITYAREDTHYLLHIYDNLKNELLELSNGRANILQSVFQKSTLVCAKRYDKPTITPTSYLDFYHSSKRLFNNCQLSALRDIFNWRDQLARTEDESIGYVLPNHMMLQISEILPKEVQGILACCNPIPPFLRQNVMTIHQIILSARAEPLVKPIVNDASTGTQRPILASSCTLDVDNPLYCPHDLSHTEDFRDDLPTIFKGLTLENFPPSKSTFQWSSSTIDLFNNKDINSSQNTHINKVSFTSPYTRYKLTLKDAEKEAQQQEKINQKKLEKKKQIQEEKEKAIDQRLVDHIRIKEANQIDGQTKFNYPGNEIGKQKRKSHDETIVIPPKIKREQDDDSRENAYVSQDNSFIKKEIQTNSNSPMLTQKQIEMNKSRNKYVKFCLEATKISNPNNNPEQTTMPITPTNKNKRKNRNKKNKNLNNSTNESSSKEEELNTPRPFQPFDYSQVDYSNYKGGSNTTPKGRSGPKERFRKGKKRFTGTGNRSSTFNLNYKK